jgi:DivIVA domain-containing protein
VITSADVVNARFAPTKFREGYDQDEVDTFLDRAAAALRAWESAAGASAGLTPEQVVAQRFQPTKFRAGYDQDAVDRYLDQLVVALREHANPGPSIT